MAALKSLADLFINELKDIYDAERQLTKALPKMAKNASNEQLQEAFQSHLEETQGQIERLEEVFKMIERPVRGKKCKAMVGLTEEGKELMDENAEPEVLDAGLICAAQKVEHYEIAAYGTLIEWARVLGYDSAVGLLEQTLQQEKAADEKLTSIASELNHRAEGEEGEAGEEEHTEEHQIVAGEQQE